MVQQLRIAEHSGESLATSVLPVSMISKHSWQLSYCSHSKCSCVHVTPSATSGHDAPWLALQAVMWEWLVCLNMHLPNES